MPLRAVEAAQGALFVPPLTYAVIRFSHHLSERTNLCCFSEQVKIAAEQTQIAAQQRDIYRGMLSVTVIQALFLGLALIFAGWSAIVAQRSLEISNRAYLTSNE